jgi:hypothetical protein
VNRGLGILVRPKAVPPVEAFDTRRGIIQEKKGSSSSRSPWIWGCEAFLVLLREVTPELEAVQSGSIGRPVGPHFHGLRDKPHGPRNTGRTLASRGLGSLLFSSAR